jgi:predicted acetyltransferase
MSGAGSHRIEMSECHGMLGYRSATDEDVQLLAEWNHQLIRDEGHRNQMTVSELQERMRGWLAGEYAAILFVLETIPVAYALYRETEREIYLRQLFVIREKRRQGIGREAVGILREQIWPQTKRLTVEVLTANHAALCFWRAVGYRDYCLTLEIMPQK